MKRLLFLLLAAVTLGGCDRGGETPPAEKAPAEAPVLVFAEVPQGFRDLAWGAEFAGLSGMVPAAAGTSGEAYYTREGEELVLGGVPLSKVEYRFVDGRFVQAIVTLAGGPEESLRLKGMLFDAYGAVGPFMAQAPERVGGEQAYKEYLWPFAGGSVALLLAAEGERDLLLFSAKAGEAAGSGG